MLKYLQIIDISQISLDDLAKLITTEAGSVRADLGKQIADLRLDLDTKFSGQISAIKSDLVAVENRQLVVESKVDQIERLLRTTDLMLKGIPQIPNENLYAVFNQICQAINFAPKDFTLQSIFRTKNQAKFPTVFAKFISANARNEFFSCYLKHRNLNLTHIGFNTTDRIYAQESLSSYYAEIFRFAMALRKNKKIHSVHTHNGLVYVKLSIDDIPKRLESLQQLSELTNTTQTDISNASNKRKLNASLEHKTQPKTKTNQNKHFKPAAAARLKSTTKSTANANGASTSISNSAGQCTSLSGIKAASECMESPINPTPIRTRHASIGGTLDGYVISMK